MIVGALNLETGKIVYFDLPNASANITVNEETINTISNQITTLQNDRDDLGDQVQDIQVDLNMLKQNAVLINAEQILKNKTIKDFLKVTGDDKVGETLLIDFLDGTTQITTNNGLDFLSNVNFVKQPTTESTSHYEDIGLDNLVTKQQISQAISDVTGTHFEKWVIMGVPQPIELTTSLVKMYMPATTRFPNVPPADIEPNSDGTGIIFKREGLIHVKRNVSLGGANTENLYYEARINDQRLEPLLAQAVSVSENTMNFSIEFYWYVYPNQEFSIWANCLKDTCTLNFKGVTTVVEYL